MNIPYEFSFSDYGEDVVMETNVIFDLRGMRCVCVFDSHESSKSAYSEYSTH